MSLTCSPVATPIPNGTSAYKTEDNLMLFPKDYELKILILKKFTVVSPLRAEEGDVPAGAV